MHYKIFIVGVFVLGLSSPVLAQGVAADGQDEFGTKCAICHSVDPAGPPGTGPNLSGVFGSAAGSRPGFAYSDAMKSSGLTWTEDNLNKFLQGPAALVPGNKMAVGFAGTTADMAADIVAYLKTLTGAAPAAAPDAAVAPAPAATPAPDAAAPVPTAPAPAPAQ